MVDFRVHKDGPDSFCPPYSTYLMSTIRGAIVLLAINVCIMPGRQKNKICAHSTCCSIGNAFFHLDLFDFSPFFRDIEIWRKTGHRSRKIFVFIMCHWPCIVLSCVLAPSSHRGEFTQPNPHLIVEYLYFADMTLLAEHIEYYAFWIFFSGLDLA